MVIAGVLIGVLNMMMRLELVYVLGGAAVAAGSLAMTIAVLLSDDLKARDA